MKLRCPKCGKCGEFYADQRVTGKQRIVVDAEGDFVRDKGADSFDLDFGEIEDRYLCVECFDADPAHNAPDAVDEEAEAKCPACGSETYTCCGSGQLRCEECDGPCPGCSDGGMDSQADEDCEHPNAVLSDPEPPATWYCPDCGENFISPVGEEEEDECLT